MCIDVCQVVFDYVSLRGTRQATYSPTMGMGLKFRCIVLVGRTFVGVCFRDVFDGLVSGPFYYYDEWLIAGEVQWVSHGLRNCLSCSPHSQHHVCERRFVM